MASNGALIALSHALLVGAVAGVGTVRLDIPVGG